MTHASTLCFATLSISNAFITKSQVCGISSPSSLYLCKAITLCPSLNSQGSAVLRCYLSTFCLIATSLKSCSLTPAKFISLSGLFRVRVRVDFDHQHHVSEAITDLKARWKLMEAGLNHIHTLGRAHNNMNAYDLILLNH